jgi:ADP-ribose pyrophosphatase
VGGTFVIHEQHATSEYVYRGRVITLRVDRMRTDAGRERIREVIEHPGAVALVPVTASGDLLLIRQTRYAAGRVLLEVPAGTLDPGEDVLTCADRELQEETGYKADRLERIGGFFVAPSYDQEYIHIYVATGLSESRLAADDDEDIEVVPVSLDQALALIEQGAIEDAKTICAVLMYAQRTMDRGRRDA